MKPLVVVTDDQHSERQRQWREHVHSAEKEKVCALAMNPIMVMNWRLLTSKTLKENSKEKNT